MMTKLDILLEKFMGTRKLAPLAVGAHGAVVMMECGAAGNFGSDCRDDNDCDCDCDCECDCDCD